MNRRYSRLSTIARTQVAVAFIEQIQTFDVAKVVKIGLNAKTILQTFRKEHPEKVPRRISQGLLAMRTPVDDLSLVIHLTSTNHPSMSKLGSKEGDPPIVISYVLANLCEDGLPDEDWLATALSYTYGMLSGKSLNSRDEIVQLSRASDLLAPYAKAGLKFKQGRKIGTVGPLALAVKRHLKKYPAHSTKQVWDALAKAQCKGMTFYDNHLGKYVEYEKPTLNGSLRSTSYRRFSNIVSEQKNPATCTE